MLHGGGPASSGLPEHVTLCILSMAILRSFVPMHRVNIYSIGHLKAIVQWNRRAPKHQLARPAGFMFFLLKFAHWVARKLSWSLRTVCVRRSVPWASWTRTSYVLCGEGENVAKRCVFLQRCIIGNGCARQFPLFMRKVEGMKRFAVFVTTSNQSRQCFRRLIGPING